MNAHSLLRTLHATALAALCFMAVETAVGQVVRSNVHASDRGVLRNGLPMIATPGIDLLGAEEAASEPLYHPFPDSRAMWRVRIIGLAGNYYTRYWLHGDTMIDDQRFHKVYHSWDYDTLHFDSSWSYLAGYVRESPPGRVIGLSPRRDGIFLLYDFNAKVGDTVSVEWLVMSGSARLIVESVDSVLVDGTWRRRLRLQSPLRPLVTETWIEGIGSTDDVFNPGAYFTSTDYEPALACFKIDGRIIYGNDCALQTGAADPPIAEESAEPSVKARGSRLEVRLPEATHFTLELFTVGGRSQLHYRGAGSSATIDISRLAAGFYLYRILSKGKRFEGRIVKM